MAAPKKKKPRKGAPAGPSPDDMMDDDPAMMGGGDLLSMLLGGSMMSGGGGYRGQEPVSGWQLRRAAGKVDGWAEAGGCAPPCLPAPMEGGIALMWAQQQPCLAPARACRC